MSGGAGPRRVGGGARGGAGGWRRWCRAEPRGAGWTGREAAERKAGSAGRVAQPHGPLAAGFLFECGFAFERQQWE